MSEDLSDKVIGYYFYSGEGDEEFILFPKVVYSIGDEDGFSHNLDPLSLGRFYEGNIICPDGYKCVEVEVPKDMVKSLIELCYQSVQKPGVFDSEYEEKVRDSADNLVDYVLDHWDDDEGDDEGGDKIDRKPNPYGGGKGKSFVQAL